MYEWLKLIHVVSAFGFILAHGASAVVALRLPKERDPGRVRALLELSTEAMGPVTWIFALVMLLTGIAAGFVGDWWGRWWIWASIVALVVVMGMMTPFGGMRLNRIREAVGITLDKKKPAPTPVPESELEALLAAWDPRPLLVAGGGGLLLILVLMVLKPV